jgi:hypothetical protein
MPIRVLRRVLPDEFELVCVRTVSLPFCHAETTPLGESGGAVLLENVSAGEAAFLVEMVEDGRVDGGEFLQTSHAPKSLHRPLPS